MGDLYAPDEEYLNVAVTRLLPEYYSAHADAGTGVVLKSLASRLIARHGDRWLADALKTAHSPIAAAAFASLGRAEEANEAWDSSTFGAEARKSMVLFQSAGSAAGMMFARLDQVFALYWNDRELCVQAASSLLQALRRLSYAWVQTQAMLEEGSCASWTGDLERADASVRAALERAPKERYPVLYFRALGLSASRHAQIGDGAAAWRENFGGLARYWAGKYPLLRAHQFYSALSQLAQRSHVTYAAVAWARELTTIDSILGYKNVYGPALWRLGIAELEAGFDADAYRDLQQSASIDPRIKSETRPQVDLAALETTQGELDKALSRLRSIQAAAENNGGLLRLQFEAELGRLFLRRGRYVESKARYEEARRIGEDSWSRASAEDRVLWSRAMADVYRGLVECEIQTGAGQRRSRALWSQYRARLFARGNAITNVQNRLPPSAAQLTFAELPSGLAVWLETAHGLEFQWIKSTELLRESVGRLARGCANEASPTQVLRADAREVSRQLLGFWDVRLDGVRSLIVETDGPVAQVPWPALVRQNGRYWSEDFAVKIRAGIFNESGTAPLTPGSPALVVGAPAFSGQEDLVALPNAVAEAKKVSDLFPRSIPLMGRAAVLSEVRERLAHAQLFHFTGHGYGGEGGGLLLRGSAGGSAILRAKDIDGLDLSRCTLVVLAGCSTAAGERGGPGDPQSLVRAFLHAGAEDVVAGLWDLDSAGTQLLVAKFYESLLSGSPVAESLSKAAAAVRSDSRYAHPYYWAGLEVFTGN
jgi:CHAT domain-containing protein